MNLRADSLQHKLNMDEDSSSDWDSLTEPAPNLQKVVPPQAHLDSESEKEKKSATPPIIPPQQARTDSPVWTPRKESKANKLQNQNNQPQDLDFRPSLSDPSSLQTTPSKRAPGKERKGNTYDPPKSVSPLASQIQLRLDDSDDDEALAELRKTYEQNRPRNSITREPPKRKAVQEPAETPATQPSASNLKSTSTGKSQSGSRAQPIGAKSSQSVLSTAGITLAADREPSNRYQGDRGLTVMVDDYHGNEQRPAAQRSDGSAQSGENLLVAGGSGGGGGGGGGGRKNDTPTSDHNTVQVYYFDEACTDHYVSKPDSRSVAVMEGYADKAELVINRGWREVFGVLRIVTLLVTVFITELIKFVIASIMRPLYVTTVVIVGDRFLKPFYAALFNGVVQPFVILVYNVAVGFRLAVGPLLDVLQKLAAMVASMLQAFRLVSISHFHKDESRLDRIQDTSSV